MTRKIFFCSMQLQNLQRDLASIVGGSGAEDSTHGVRHPATLADDTTGVILRYFQPQHHPITLRTLGHPYLIRVFDKSLGHKLDELFHRFLPLKA